MANKKVSQLVSKPSVLVTDLFPIADPTTGQLFKTTISDLGTAIGSGVSSVNTLVGAVVLDTDDIQELASPTNRWFTDTRARAALSASSPLAYNSGTGVFSIPAATSSQDGYLTSADWTTFNAKQPALSGTGFVKISGTTISYDNSTYLTTSAAASTYLALSGGTLTGALNGTSATFTGDLTLSASNPRLYLTDTDNNPDYFISNTDGTFTIYDVTNSTSRLTISTLNTILNTNLRVNGDVLINQDSVLGGVSGYTAIASDTDGIFLKLGTASAHAYLVLSGLTNYRNFTFPDATGTLALTSDLSAYLPLTGGVLSGSLRSTGYYLTGMTSGSGALYYSSGSNRVTVANYNASGIVSFEVNGGNTALTLNSNLSATFAGALSGTSATFSGLTVDNNQNGSTWIISKNQNTGSGAAAGFLMTNNTGDLGAISLLSSGNSPANGLFIRTLSTNSLILGTNSTANLTIASGGAATFSSSVTANNLISSAGAGFAGVDIKSDRTTGNLGGFRAYRGTESFSRSEILMKADGAITFNNGDGATNVNERVAITSSGNVGIGTTAPGRALDVFGSNGSATAQIKVKNPSFTQSGYFGCFAGNTYISAGGTFDSGWTLDGTNGVSAIVLETTNGGSSIAFQTAASNTSPSNSMIITSGGSVLVNTTDSSGLEKMIAINSTNNAGYKISVNGSVRGYVFADASTYYIESANSTRIRVWVNSANGVYLDAGNTSWTSNSDERLKTALTPITDALNKVSQLRSVIGRFKTDEESVKRSFLIAQDVQSVLPEAINIDKETGMLGVQYTEVIPLLVASIKELKAELDTLKNK